MPDATRSPLVHIITCVTEVIIGPWEALWILAAIHQLLLFFCFVLFWVNLLFFYFFGGEGVEGGEFRKLPAMRIMWNP